MPQRQNPFAPNSAQDCQRVLENEADDLFYIKPGVPLEAFNMSIHSRFRIG